MKSIFKAYDVRGVYPIEINEKIFYEIGLRFKQVGIKKIAVGKDARLSSESLASALIEGLTDAGIIVLDLGLVTSPMLSLFCVMKKIDGIMITASHNPKEYNGIKFIDKNGIQLGYREFWLNVEKNLKNKIDKNKKPGPIEKINFIPEYERYLLEKFGGFSSRKIKAVIDFSNGVGVLNFKIIKKFDIEAIALNGFLDGNFPAHSPDNTKIENFNQLRKEVLKQGAEIGVMFDGDADRCAFIDEKGEIVPMYSAFLILALYEINRSKIKKPKILFDLRYSKVVPELIKTYGAIPVVMRVGNPFYKKALQRKKDAIMAGELSGHIMYKENFGIDDPLFAFLKMIKILTSQNMPFSELVKTTIIYYSSGEISFSVKDREKVINKLIKKYKKYKIKKIDGISVEKKDVWFNIRFSNTEPLIRLIIEGNSKSAVEKMKNELLTLIK